MACGDGTFYKEMGWGPTDAAVVLLMWWDGLQESGVMDLVDIRHGDALEVDLTTATAMFLYLVPRVRDRSIAGIAAHLCLHLTDCKLMSAACLCVSIACCACICVCREFNCSCQSTTVLSDLETYWLTLMLLLLG